MAELARTLPLYRRLFQTVDMAPRPQHAAIAQALDAWRARRGRALAPDALDLVRSETGDVRKHSFLLEERPGGDELMLRAAGSSARRALGGRGDGRRLSALASPRLAVRVRRLFELVAERGEPIDVLFTDRGRRYELLLAPVASAGPVKRAFCAVASDAGTA